jgi:pilus assembly protein Flp/PilA
VVAVVPWRVAAFETRCARHNDARVNERDVMNLITYVRALLRNDSGQDLLEYALLVALIALVCVGVITQAGGGVETIFTNITGELQKAGGAGAP